MYEQIEKSQENKSKAVSSSVVQKKSNVRQDFSFEDNRDKPVLQKYISSQNSLLGIQRVSKSDVTPSSFSNNLVQLKKSDALRYAIDNNLVSADKKDISKDEVITLLKNKLTLPQREGLRKAWNKKNPQINCISASDAGYADELRAAEAENLERFKAAKPVAGLDEIDSDDDGEMAHILEVKSLLEQATGTKVVTQQKESTTAYLLLPPVGLRVLHLIKKFKLFDDFRSIHIIFQVGSFWQLYTAPRGNDFAYAPLLQLRDNLFQRGGGVDSWSAIAHILHKEMQEEEGRTFRDQISRIVLTFQGKGGPLTEGECHAIGAIICDFAAGIEGARHYLAILHRAVDNGETTTHAKAWDGRNPTYEPAKIEGRGLMAAHRQGQAKKQKRNRGEGGVDSAEEEKEEVPMPRRRPVDIAQVADRAYTPNVEGIRDMGQCFWDTMIAHGAPSAAIQEAATRAGVRYNHHINEDQIGTVLAHLRTAGHNFRVNVDRFNLMTMKFLKTVNYGNESGTSIYIGFFIDPSTNLGHFVPPRK
ncbi:MAG: hypothetical protein ACKVGT_11110 [Flavobacteriales bacterium]